MESIVVNMIRSLNTEGQDLLYSELRYEKELNRCYRLMHAAEELSSVMEPVLGISCNYLRADKGLFFAKKGDFFFPGGKWPVFRCEGEKPDEDGRGVHITDFPGAKLLSGGVIAVDNAAEIEKACPALIRTFAGTEIKSMLLAPVKSDGELCACMAYCNTRVSNRNAYRFLSSLARFMSISAEREERRRTLAALSYTDALTGCLNRTKFYEDIGRLSKQKGVSAGVIYVDINGLKLVNDIYAHEAGDELLRECAEMLTVNCPGSQVYRIGGDEFIVLESGVSGTAFEALVRKVRNAFEKNNGCNAALGSSWMSDTADIERHVSIADREMYRNKREYYGSAGNDRYLQN